MASQLKVDTITGVTTAGSIAVTAEGNSTTTNLQSGLAKAWVNYNHHTGPTVRKSFNVSSMTDTATGKFQANWTNSFNDICTVQFQIMQMTTKHIEIMEQVVE